jgi:hypothetical protein
VSAMAWPRTTYICILLDTIINKNINKIVKKTYPKTHQQNEAT